ncbi:MAG: ABC transporter permease subunit [Calditrichota bacterium]
MAKKKEIRSAYASESLFRKRLRRFRSIKRGYYSFLFIVGLYILSFFSPMLINYRALAVRYEGRIYFPALKYYPGLKFGQDVYGETNYRELKRRFKFENKGNWVLMPLYPFGPNESLTDNDPLIRLDDITDRFKFVNYLRNPADSLSEYMVNQLSPKLRADIQTAPDYLNPEKSLVKATVKEMNDILKGVSLYKLGFASDDKLSESALKRARSDPMTWNLRWLNREILSDVWPGAIVKNRQPPTPPTRFHWFGSDDRGRDVFARIFYGFNISMSFALLIVSVTYLVGISVGAALGYFGGKFDIIMQRFIEIWSSIPFLYTVIIISSIVQPNFFLLVGLLCAFGWTGLTWYIRGEFYREKARDYVHAAIAIGVNDRNIVFKHILPNALTPVIAFGPFAIVGGIASLVSLDYLGFGLPPPTPSWGELVNQGMANIFSWWLVLCPLGAMFVTLLAVVFIGEAIRQALDPREYSRLR